MHVQAQMSGQLSSHVPNPAGSQLSVLPHMNVGSMAPQMSAAWKVDPDFIPARKFIQEKIRIHLQRQGGVRDWARLNSLTNVIEGMLLKEASSKEDYMDLNTLGPRIQNIIKRSATKPSHPQTNHMSSSSFSVATMIPTPGMAQAKANTVLSSADNSLIPTGGGNGPITSTTNSVNFVSSNSNLVIQQGGYTNASDGSTNNMYQKPLPSVSVGMAGFVSQMIPTPGLSNSQNMTVSAAGRNGPSSTEPTMIPQRQNQKPYIGTHGSQMMPSATTQMGMLVRPNTDHKSTTHVFPSGAVNSGLMPNGGHLANTQIMNGNAFVEGLLSNTINSISPRSLPQQFDHQRMMQGNIKTTGLQSKFAGNSLLQSHQSNLQPLQQASQIKPQPIHYSPNVSLQGPKMNQEQFNQLQQQLQIQQQNKNQEIFLLRHQLQKQKNRETQQFSKGDMLKQDQIPLNPQLAATSVGQMIPDRGVEAHIEGINHTLADVSWFDMQNQYQLLPAVDNHPRESHMLIQSASSQIAHNIVPEPPFQAQQSMQNVLQVHSINSQIENSISGHLIGPPDDNTFIVKQPSGDHSWQAKYAQGIDRKAYQSHEGFTSQNVTVSNSVLEGAKGVVATGLATKSDDLKVVNQKKWLLLMFHARECSRQQDKCTELFCGIVRDLWKHMRDCKDTKCTYPRCSSASKQLGHYIHCTSMNCPICVPVRDWIKRRLEFIKMSSNCGNLLDVSIKSESYVDAIQVVSDTSLTYERIDDMQPSAKRMKLEYPSPSSTLTAAEQKYKAPPSLEPPKEKLEAFQQIVMPVPTASEVKEVTMGASLQHGGTTDSDKLGLSTAGMSGLMIASQIPKQIKVDVDEHSLRVHQETDKIMQEVNQDKPTTDSAGGTKHPKSVVKGVSLIELFTPEQIKDHIYSLRQWTGQSKAKVEKNQAMERVMTDNSCQLCGVEKLNFEPPPIYCSQCINRIKRNATYYTSGGADTRFYFCGPCYNGPQGDTIEVDGSIVVKAKLEKKKNDEEAEEWWVQCDKCNCWQHQICALFNGRRNDGGQAEYTCPNCLMAEMLEGGRKPLPESAVLGAKDLPRTILSDHIEQRLAKRLKEERQKRADTAGKSFDEVDGAEDLVVRVVSSVDKKLEVKQRFLEIFQEENYPAEFPYKSKAISLFQKIDGVEVFLFGMYVQEFGAECVHPNQRRVYLSYLDSVKYFRPEIKAATGEALRTFVYHEILIGYLEYCKMRGFTSCYIWACPPMKGDDYILYCHPEIQKTPKSDKLREWYLSMLRKAARENIVIDVTNLHDHFFVSTGDCKAKVTASRLPYFEGDYWPGAAEDMINKLIEEEDGIKQQKKGKTKKTISKRALKAAGHGDLSSNASKDLLLMRKLGEAISPMKEDFIMVHLQHACSRCCNLMVSGYRWVCRRCKNFQMCDKCYDSELGLDEKERHPSNSKEKHDFYPVEVTGIPTDTKDKDENIESEFFDTRQAFLSLCQGNHYQNDTLRRAKHSSMMVLFHLHNPTAPAFVTTCNVCVQEIEAGRGWRCEVCPEYDVCNTCYQKDGVVEHPHRLVKHASAADGDSEKERQERFAQARKVLDLLVHASGCRSAQCPNSLCRKIKNLFRHGSVCTVRSSGGCLMCKKIWQLLQMHARVCKVPTCSVPRCRDLKEHARRWQQQSDSRRRAAVTEMMRQRAAEAAGKTTDSAA